MYDVELINDSYLNEVFIFVSIPLFILFAMELRENRKLKKMKS